MKSVLIIGASHLTKALTVQLKSMGVRVYATSSSIDTNAITVHKDLFALTSNDIPNVQLVMYFPTLDNKRNASYRKAYQHSLAHLLDIIPKKTKVLFGSSSLIYGDHIGKTVTEHSIINAHTERELAILAGEKLLKTGSNPYLILRIGNIYESITPLAKAINSGMATYSQRTQYTNYIHQEDLVNAVIATMPYYGVFNVSDGAPITLNTVLSMMSARLGKTISTPKKWIPRSKGVKLSNAKLMATGFSFKHPSLTTFKIASYSP